MNGTSAQQADAAGDTLIRLRRPIYDDLATARGAKTLAKQVELTGVPERSLVRIRQGRPPSIGNAMRIASAFSVPFDVLFERVGD